MPGEQRPDRDLTNFVLPEFGQLLKTGDPWEPYQVLDPFGRPVEPVATYLRDLMAADSSRLTPRSYGMDLLRWWRYLWACGIEWDRAVRGDARDFRLYQEEAWKKGVPRRRAQPLWWTLRRPWRPLEYDAARMMFNRGNELLGSNWTLHDLRHTATFLMLDDPNMPPGRAWRTPVRSKGRTGVGSHRGELSSAGLMRGAYAS
ncbi:hypothetical protein ABIE67_009609 [Streptomyces sp. V4I8]|uniref:hypothetical protein n=1 Tax=Streptomyces sp. V4I8 TaxID=3156469 RepID=UPI0035181286